MATVQPKPFRSVDLSTLAYGTMVKDTSARLYVVPIEPPVTVISPPVKTTTAFEDDVPFVYIEPMGAFADFFKKSEDAILQACIQNKGTWFATQHEDDALRRGFKSFFKDGAFKLKVPVDAAFFDAKGNPINRDDIPIGSTVRVAIELSRVCFGRHEFGSTWKLLQAKLVETQCLIRDEPPEDPVDAVPEDPSIDSDSDAHEFL